MCYCTCVKVCILHLPTYQSRLACLLMSSGVYPLKTAGIKPLFRKNNLTKCVMNNCGPISEIREKNELHHILAPKGCFGFCWCCFCLSVRFTAPRLLLLRPSVTYCIKKNYSILLLVLLLDLSAAFVKMHRYIQYCLLEHWVGQF